MYWLLVYWSEVLRTGCTGLPYCVLAILVCCFMYWLLGPVILCIMCWLYWSAILCTGYTRTCHIMCCTYLQCTQDCIGTTLMASAMGSSAGQLIPIEGILHRCTASIDSAHPICSVGNDVACGGGGEFSYITLVQLSVCRFSHRMVHTCVSATQRSATYNIHTW